MTTNLYWIFSAILVCLTILSFKINRALFPGILFFTITHTLQPVNLWFTKVINFEFAGTFFLFPIVIYTLLIITIPEIKRNTLWFTKDKINKKTILLIIAMTLASITSLIIWGNYNTNNLDYFVNNMPKVPLVWIIINGILFALFNAIAEEYLSRGMLYNTIEKLTSNTTTIIVVQAIVFALFHYKGFPGGINGMIMVFCWSLVLGIIRFRTKGLIGVLIAHFFADLAIYLFLYTLV